MNGLLSNGKFTSFLRFAFLFVLIMFACTTIWILILITFCVVDYRLEFMPYMITLFGGGGIVTIILGFLKVRQKKYETTEKEKEIET